MASARPERRPCLGSGAADSMARPEGPLLLLGAGGHGRVVAEIAEALGWNDIAFLDRLWPELRINLIWPVIGTVDDLNSPTEARKTAIATIGSNRPRLELHRRLIENGFAVPHFVHPSATISRYAVIGRGTVVMPGAVVNAGARIGEAVIVNTGASIDHDCRIGDGVHISPGACLAGQVAVGERSWIGIGAVVRESVTVGRDVMIGAGAAVVMDIGDSQTATGVPARTRTGT